jgi:hypothetical protein
MNKDVVIVKDSIPPLGVLLSKVQFCKLIVTLPLLYSSNHSPALSVGPCGFRMISLMKIEKDEGDTGALVVGDNDVGELVGPEVVDVAVH